MATSFKCAPNGLEVSRPPALASPLSLYARLAGRASVHFAQLGGSAPPSCWAASKILMPLAGPLATNQS